MAKKKKSSAFAVVQQIGKSFFLPVSVLPIAGILLGLGSSFTNADTIAAYHLQGIMGEGTILNALLTIMSQVGNTIFGNLPLIFALAVALGMAKNEKAVAVLSGVLPVKRTIKNNKFLYRQPCYGWRYFMLLLCIAYDIPLVSLHVVFFEVVHCCNNLCN